MCEVVFLFCVCVHGILCVCLFVCVYGILCRVKWFVCFLCLFKFVFTFVSSQTNQPETNRRSNSKNIKQTNKQTLNKQTHKQTNKESNEQTNKVTHTSFQTNRHSRWDRKVQRPAKANLLSEHRLASANHANKHVQWTKRRNYKNKNKNA